MWRKNTTDKGEQVGTESQTTVDETGGGKKPFIKITTIKLFAQLPQTGMFLSTSSALRALLNIAESSSHVDVRSAVLRTLINSFREQSSVLAFFRSWGVQTMSEPSERYIITEEEWAVAEQGGELPDIATCHDQRPMLHMFITKDETLLGIALESLRLMSEKESRWMSIFAKRHGGVDLNMTALPAELTLLLRVFELLAELNVESGRTCIPLQDFKAMKAYVSLALDPPASVKRINNLMRSNPDLRNSNAGKHWLRIWTCDNKGRDAFGINRMFNILELCDARSESVAGEASQSMLGNLLFDFLAHLVNTGDVEAFNRHLQHYTPRSHPCEHDGPGQDGREVLRRLLDYIMNMRTHEWNSNPSRKPRRLPDTFTLRLKLICLPPHRVVDKDCLPRDKIAAYTRDEVIPLLKLISQQTVYHNNFERLRNQLNYEIKHRLSFASHLGVGSLAITGHTGLLCMHIAAFFLMVLSGRLRDEDQDEEDWDRVRKVLEAWERSPVEEARELVAQIRQTWLQFRQYGVSRAWLFKGDDYQAKEADFNDSQDPYEGLEG